MELGHRSIDVNFDWKSESFEFSDNQIKGFETFISNLKFPSQQNDSTAVQAYFPTKSQQGALDVLRNHLSKGPKAQPLHLLVVGQGGCGEYCTGKTFFNF